MKSSASTYVFPWSYFALTFGFSWLIWLPAVLGSQGILPLATDQFAESLAIAGFFGPMFAASVLTYREHGFGGLRQFLGRLLNFRIPFPWWIVIAALPIGIQAIAHFLPLGLGEPVQPSFVSSAGMFFQIFLIVTILGGGQEEVGWRAYVLERLQARFNALNSSLILGAFWTVWHLPLWFMPGTSEAATPFGAFVVVCLSLSIILTWIYNNTGRNMVAAILAHGMVNAAHALFPVIKPAGNGQSGYIYWAATLALVSVLVTLIWGAATLTRRKVKDQNQDDVHASIGSI